MRGTKKVRHGRLRPLSPLVSLIRFDPFPFLVPCMPCAKRRIRDKKGRAEEKGASSLSLRSFGLHFFCPPLPPSPIFISLSSSSAGLESLSRSLCISLFFCHFSFLSFPFSPSFLVPRQENQRKESGRAMGEEGHKVSEEENTSLLSSSTSSSWFITSGTVR